MLRLFMEHAKGRRDGIIVANWYLHPDGFAFQIPDGLAPAGKRRGGVSLMLVDPSQENSAYQTYFELSITNGEDKSLKTMQREEAERAFSSRIERFSLISFSRVIVCGEDGVRLTYLAKRSPRLQIQQCMFIKNGKTYITNIASENKLHSLPTAWRQFDTVYETLFFIEYVK